MNLFNVSKNMYWPCFYTYNTRFFWFRNYKNYIISNVFFPFLPLIFLFLSHQRYFTLVYSALLYIFYFYLFSIFYEIGYICNDFYSVRKEKAPSVRISGLVEKDVRLMIIQRVLLGILCIIFLYLANKELTTLFVVAVLFMGLVFIIHNIFRNFFVNLLTVFILKLSKFLIVVAFLYYFGFLTYLPTVLLYFFIDNIVEIILNNNMRLNLQEIILGNSNYSPTPLPTLFFYKLPDMFFHFSMIIFSICSFLLTFEYLHLIYLAYYIPIFLAMYFKVGLSIFNR